MDKTTYILTFDRFLFWLHHVLNKIRNWAIGLLSGFLLGRAINELSVQSMSWQNLLKNLFSISERSTNWLTWISFILLILIPLVSIILTRYKTKIYRNRRYERIFESLVQEHKSPLIAPFNAIGWNSVLSLQTCPELSRGWFVSKVKLQHNATQFSLPKEYEQLYQEYFKKYYHKKRFFDDRTKIMLTRNPIAFSDSSTLVLNTQETLFSQVMFYIDNSTALALKHDELIDKVYNKLDISFPHSLCMHTIVVTKDEKVFISKRSPKVAHYPETWSCSVEEQISLEDLQENQNRIVLKWFERLLNEELGLGEESYNKDNLRILSVFLDTDTFPSISLCGHVVLDIDSNEMNQIIENRPRKDYEFTGWDFLTHKQLLEELFYPTLPYHPTSGYRMLMALIRRYGEIKVAMKLFSRDKNNMYNIT